MKNLIFAFILAVAGIGTIKAQQADSVVYIVGTSFLSNEKITGFIRMHDTDNPQLYRNPSSTFIIRSMEKDFELWFMHHNFNLTELAKKRRVFPSDTMKILFRPKSELASYANMVDANEMIRTKTQEQMWQWIESLKGKTIYIIDRNDFFVENGVEKMKLIEVGLIFSNKPIEPDFIIEEE